MVVVMCVRISFMLVVMLVAVVSMVMIVVIMVIPIAASSHDALLSGAQRVLFSTLVV